MSKEWDPVERRYRELPREEPSAEVDAKVLAAARSAVAPRSFMRRWGAPLGAAAMVVLAVGVTLQVQREERKPAGAPVPAPATSAVQEQSATPKRESAPEPIPFAPRRPLEQVPAAPQAETATVVPLQAKIAPAPALAPAAPPPASAGNLGVAARLQKDTEDAARAAARAAPAPAGAVTVDEVTTAGVRVKIVPQQR